ncbi:ribonuclease BN (tRNA processing enzyme) [Bradyrhizobium sp. BR13661]|nr:ribonuclease BN (tRNA processing enzyme) [Bradyrhizobium sp. BR13661]
MILLRSRTILSSLEMGQESASGARSRHRRRQLAGRGSAVRLNQLGILPGQIDATFITHFHSDHLNGLPDLWTLGYIGRPNVRCTKPLDLWGPTGIKRITDAMCENYLDDVKIRTVDEKVAPTGTEFAAHEFAGDGVVFDRNGVRVTAFAVNQGEFIHPAYGYRIDFNGHAVPLPGDTRFDQKPDCARFRARSGRIVRRGRSEES